MEKPKSEVPRAREDRVRGSRSLDMKLHCNILIFYSALFRRRIL